MPPKVHIHSLKVVQVQQYSKITNTLMGHGTAFFCCKAGQIYLVTNHHVVSGFRPGTKELLHSAGAVPRRLQFNATVMRDKSETEFKTSNLNASIALYDADDSHLWLEHPTLKNSCDVVAIPMPEEILQLIPENCEIQTIELERELDYECRLFVMDELFITGFPLVKEDTLTKYPIYKAGFLASEPEDDQNGAQFYVDSKTKPGMSGSPVIQKERMKIENTGNGKITASEGRINFIGIYSGRVGATEDEYQSELGVIWPFKQFLMPIIEAHQSAK